MKFQINTLMLKSMGWKERYGMLNFFSKNIPVDATIYFKSKDTVFYISCIDGRTLFNRRTIEDIEMRYDCESPATEINSNTELFRLVIDNEAFDDAHIRHFKISRLLR